MPCLLPTPPPSALSLDRPTPGPQVSPPLPAQFHGLPSMSSVPSDPVSHSSFLNSPQWQPLELRAKAANSEALSPPCAPPPGRHWAASPWSRRDTCPLLLLHMLPFLPTLQPESRFIPDSGALVLPKPRTDPWRSVLPTHGHDFPNSPQQPG